MKLPLLLLTLVCAAGLRADEIWTGDSDVKFHGDSTLHGFDGTVNDVPLTVSVSGTEGSRVVSAVSEVKVKNMDTNHEGRDENMMKMFQQTEFPLIKVEVVGAQEAKLQPKGGKPGAMTVKLTIIGKSNRIDASVTNLKQTADSLSFDLSFPVSLKAFSLEAPSALLGMVKVRDTVEVTAHITLRRKAA